MRLQIEVRVWRGTVLESRHRVQAALCRPDGRLEAGTEQASLVTTFRSAAKPFQLLPLVERGHADRWSPADHAHRERLPHVMPQPVFALNS